MDDMTPTDELRALLDGLGIEWKSETNCDTYWRGRDRTFYQFTEYSDGSTTFSTCQLNLTPRQALTTPIAATVGNSTDLASRLRKVTGLRSFAELFGFSWEDESDWSWHDVACAMADAIDATAGVGTCEGDIGTDHFECELTTFECRGCGWSGVVDNIRPGYGYGFDGTDVPRHCPNCGRKVTE
jgi:hypothetical protein